MARLRYPRQDQANSDCTPAANENKPLATGTTGTDTNSHASVGPQDNILNSMNFAYSTASGDPGTEDLGSGDWSFQMDVINADSPMTYRVEFHVTSAGCTSQGSAVMAEADFSGTGTKTATATWDPPSGERWQVQVFSGGNGMHGDPTMNFDIQTNNSGAPFTELSVPDAPAAPTAGHPKLLLTGAGF